LIKFLTKQFELWQQMQTRNGLHTEFWRYPGALLHETERLVPKPRRWLNSGSKQALERLGGFASSRSHLFIINKGPLANCEKDRIKLADQTLALEGDWSEKATPSLDYECRIYQFLVHRSGELRSAAVNAAVATGKDPASVPPMNEFWIPFADLEKNVTVPDFGKVADLRDFIDGRPHMFAVDSDTAASSTKVQWIPAPPVEE